MGLFGPDPGTETRLRRVERMIERIAEQLGLDMSEPVDAEVIRLARAGRKLEAIKRHRELTGADLAEAKSVIDSLGR
jgi:ribosomal protein L7/L12